MFRRSCVVHGEIFQIKINFNTSPYAAGKDVYCVKHDTHIIIHYAYNLSSFLMFFNTFVYDHAAANLLPASHSK